MEKETETIEVEIVEIDGVAPVPPPGAGREEEPSRQQGWNEWRNWQGKVSQLDMRWWPLWVFLGVVLLFLIFTVGIALGLIYGIYRIIRGILSGIASAFR